MCDLHEIKTLPLMKWLEDRILESQMCYYWKTILDFQILVLRNFQVHVECFVSIIKWYFALDHYNYARYQVGYRPLFSFGSLQLCQVGYRPLFSYLKGFALMFVNSFS